MKPRRLLYLSAHQLTAWHWQSGQLVSDGVFATTEAAHRQFADYLRQHAKSTFALLVNIAEEGFQIETIPYLRGADRQAVIDRKLGQLFFNATLTASRSLGYEKSRRKDEHVLLAALTGNTFLEPWLQDLRTSGVALSGVYSLPLLAAALLQKLQIKDEHCLLLTVQDQSIRQSYYVRGELHFSRLTPLQNSSIAGMAQALAGEAIKLQQYLASQRQVGRSQEMTAHILAHASALNVIRHSCIDSATIRYHMLDIEACARQAGLKTAITDSHSEALFLHLLATAPPPIQFANDDLRHNHHLGQIRAGLHGIGAIALAGGLLFSANTLLDAYAAHQKAGQLQAETAQLRQRHDAIVKTLPPIPVDHETLRQLIQRYRTLESRSATPDGMYRAISHALQKVPAADIEAIDWHVGGPKTALDNSAQPTQPDSTESAILRGNLKLGNAPGTRLILASFTRFVEALSAEPQLEVIVLKRPIDIESSKALKDSDLLADDDTPRTFTLQLIRKVGP